MKVSIIGAGNMGGAMARGLAKCKGYEIMLSNPTRSKLDAISCECKEIRTTTNNVEAARWGDLLILAVKPKMMQTVVTEIRSAINGEKQIVSIAAGVSTERISSWLGRPDVPVYCVIPNTAISIRQSMTFVAPGHADNLKVEVVASTFEKLGKVMIVDEHDIPACMALASCGIAYAMRYARANMEGAIELGLKPEKALEIIEQTMVGAARLLEASNAHPEYEIDKVATPSGFTIKGLNTLERNGFSAAVIEALKASV